MATIQPSDLEYFLAHVVLEHRTSSALVACCDSATKRLELALNWLYALRSDPSNAPLTPNEIIAASKYIEHIFGTPHWVPIPPTFGWCSAELQQFFWDAIA